jgi:hypothetical protein
MPHRKSMVDPIPIKEHAKYWPPFPVSTTEDFCPPFQSETEQQIGPQFQDWSDQESVEILLEPPPRRPRSPSGWGVDPPSNNDEDIGWIDPPLGACGWDHGPSRTDPYAKAGPSRKDPGPEPGPSRVNPGGIRNGIRNFQ